MATVTVFTSARMQAIENASVVSGTVTAGNLILTKFNGTTINAGSVIGPTGPTGPTGEVTTAAMNAAINTAAGTGAITEAKLATGSVTTIKIVDGNVTEGKLASNAVSAIKILDGSVTEGKLANLAITNAKISASAAIAASKLVGVYIRSGATTNNTIHVSTAAPTGGADGDVWLKY
jgi:hypothetical protein